MVAQQCECTEFLRTVHLQMVKMVNFMLYIFYQSKKKKNTVSSKIKTALLLCAFE